MFKFAVKNYRATLTGVVADSRIFPWVIEQEGAITTDQAVDKTGLCTVNGLELCPGSRVIVFGKSDPKLSIATHREFGHEWEICLDWDGCDLTTFPDKEYLVAGLPKVPAID